jgi:hypothetical protein
MTERMRRVRCPACSRESAIRKSVPTTARLRCTTCKATMLAREAIPGPNDRPCKWRPQASSAKASKNAAAADVLARYPALPPDGDSLDGL